MAPRFARAEDGVQGDDELSHDGGNDDFGRLAVPFKFIGEEAHDGIVLDGDERRHRERLADSGSPRLDMARPFELSAIVVYWRKARHAGGPGLCECADLGHVSQDRRDGRRADAFERLHEARLARERFAGFEACCDLGLKRRQGFAKAGNMRLKASADA